MAQKDKVKELVGRGLHSYHTKSLQQIDRIERKNKEQNHKISILTNELDNDYLTKTEEGSVISLEHSKEGMVYLDELQGNTLVNYCPDGAKELTLNGDIDVEGTFITTTEGVDNGKVDVMCEGNTLVNLFNYNNLSHNVNTHVNRIITLPHGGVCDCIFPTKTNVTYTVMLDIIDLPTDTSLRVGLTDSSQWYPSVDINKSGFHKIKLENKGQAIDRLRIHQLGLVAGDGKAIRVKDIMILEGDWSDREVPSYFEGMKSVGQDDTNGHKIEILSQNKNVLSEDYKVFEKTTLDGYRGYKFKLRNNTAYILTLKLKPNCTMPSSSWFTLTNSCDPNRTTHYKHIISNSALGYAVSDNCSQVTISPNYRTEDGCLWLSTYINGGDHKSKEYYDKLMNCIDYIQIEEGAIATDYISPKSNKKEISLNEPLRGLPSGIKDRFIKQGGKWYIQRNVGEYIFKGNEINSSQGSVNETNLLYWNNAQSTLKNKANVNEVLSDKLPHGKQGTSNTKGIEGISFNSSGMNLLVDIKKTMAETNEFLKDSKIIYQLATPIYEEITDAELITHLDTTYISNNSTIPCNMKIQNSGYNAIIKPSTLYTVALDTNKSGTIGLNLGGAKVTTNNNVATITTPATLTDDSLRLYGKGIKASKVRLLEGDKTNWIPSFFEGMKSSFEDKVQDDGTYKMEILSNNKNLFKGQIFPRGNSSYKFEDGNVRIFRENTPATWGYQYFTFDAKPNTTYTLSVKNINVINGSANINIVEGMVYNGELKDGVNYGGLKKGGKVTFTTNSYIGKDVKVAMAFYCSQEVSSMGDVIYENIQIEENSDKTDFINNKSNKIQFSSIEPLRGVGNVKDRFVFKEDGKLMIERNCKQVTLNGLETNIDLYNTEHDKIAKYAFRGMNPYMKLNKIPKCDKFSSKFYNSSINIESVSVGGSNDLHVYINKSRLINVSVDGFKQWLQDSPMTVTYELAEPTYEEIPFELQKIILEGYENGTLFLDTNIPPTVTTTYAGETPIVKATRLNKTEVSNNTTDINDNIVPYLMDMDYRVVCLQLEGGIENVSMARLFGGTFEMLQRDILSNRYSKEEYKYRLDAYLCANKITEKEYEKFGDMLND